MIRDTADRLYGGVVSVLALTGVFVWGGATRSVGSRSGSRNVPLEDMSGV